MFPSLFSAQPLTGFESNGPGLEYKVQWRQMNVDEDWSTRNVANVSQFVVSGTPTYVPYEIRVQAINDYGSGPDPETVIGYSGEECEQTSYYCPPLLLRKQLLGFRNSKSGPVVS